MSAVPGDQRAQNGGHADAPEGDEDHDQSDPVELIVNLVERAYQLQREALVEWHGQHANVRAGDGGVREELVALAPGCLERRLRDREGRLIGVGAGDGAVLAGDLHEHVARLEPRAAAVGHHEASLARFRIGLDPERLVRHEGRLLAQCILDLPAQLVSHEHVDDSGCDRHRRRHGERGRERLPQSEAHGSRRA